jgi:hypothetical protein
VENVAVAGEDEEISGLQPLAQRRASFNLCLKKLRTIRNDWIGYDERMIACVLFFFTYLAFKLGLPQIPTNSR